MSNQIVRVSAFNEVFSAELGAEGVNRAVEAACQPAHIEFRSCVPV